MRPPKWFVHTNPKLTMNQVPPKSWADSLWLPGLPAAAEPLLPLASRITASPTETAGSTSLLRSTRVKLAGSLWKPPEVLLGLSPPGALVSGPFLCGLCTTWTMLCCSRSQFCWSQVETHREGSIKCVHSLPGPQSHSVRDSLTSGMHDFYTQLGNQEWESVCTHPVSAQAPAAVPGCFHTGHSTHATLHWARNRNVCVCVWWGTWHPKPKGTFKGI